MSVTIVRVEEIGSRGTRRTVRYLSNGWWINENCRTPNQHRYALYKPGVGGRVEHATKIKTSNKIRPLLEHADGMAVNSA